MSPEHELQRHIYSLLRADTDLTALVSGRVYDRIEKQKKVYPFVAFGPHDVTDDSAECIDSGEHSLQIDVYSEAVGATEAKDIIYQIKKVLDGNNQNITEHALVSLTVRSRRTFTDLDDLSTRGVVTVTAHIEEK